MAEVVEREVLKAKPEVKRYKVIIHSGEEKAEKADVPLVHNYNQILIQRDKEVVINEHFLEVLRNSVITTFIKNDEKQDVEVRIPRFSFSVSPA